jgi:ribonucleoside-diphosphate reductase beta chain
MNLKAVNWNRPDDDFSLLFWNQNIQQFWTDDEIPLSDDKMSWMEMTDVQRDTYMKVLGGLTLLDTLQGGVGMPKILEHVDGLQRKAVLGFMSMMEQIHAKSYSSIFTTLATTEQIDAVFSWVETNPQLQFKGKLIESFYKTIDRPARLYLAMSASVLLESFLFYSGFFYPLYLAGQGKMTSSGEIIDLILRDESIHGVYVGVIAQEIYAELEPEVQNEVKGILLELLNKLMENEDSYTEEIYAGVGLVDEVKQFVRYNANKAFMNLGIEPIYDDVQINPIVQNGINTGTKQHDFFSKKGNGYVRALNVERMTEEDFVF